MPRDLDPHRWQALRARCRRRHRRAVALARGRSTPTRCTQPILHMRVIVFARLGRPLVKSIFPFLFRKHHCYRSLSLLFSSRNTFIRFLRSLLLLLTRPNTVVQSFNIIFSPKQFSHSLDVERCFLVIIVET